MTAGASYYCLPVISVPVMVVRLMTGGQGWFIDGEIAGRLIEGVRALNQDVLIDYEHNQLRKDKGLPPEQLVAAGWFNADEMQWRR